MGDNKKRMRRLAWDTARRTARMTACGVAWVISGPLMATSAAAGSTAVETGIWEVQMLTRIERRPSSGAQPVSQTSTPSRSYRICIGLERARAPMLPANLPRGSELIYDAQGYAGLAEEQLDGGRLSTEFSFRRLSGQAFEGTYDASGPAGTTRSQYFAQHIQSDCGALPARLVQSLAEP